MSFCWFKSFCPCVLLLAQIFLSLCPSVGSNPFVLVFLNGFLTKNTADRTDQLCFLMLSYQDSNLDRQNQKLQCYHYTIRQS